jgi:hypothetical protein
MRNASISVAMVLALALACGAVVVAVTAQADTHVIAPSDVQVVVAPASTRVMQQGTSNLDPIEDCGDSDGMSDQWSYICAIGEYQAWFAFDVSAFSPTSTIVSMAFTGFMANQEATSVERSLWYESDDSWIVSGCPGAVPADVLVGTLTHGASAMAWETFDINLAAHDFTTDFADGIITLMVSGPTGGAHDCGTIDLTESGNVPYLTIVGPQGAGIPTVGIAGLLLLVALLAGAGFLLLRR